jgi:phospholipid transport system substrate-binding protein
MTSPTRRRLLLSAAASITSAFTVPAWAADDPAVAHTRAYCDALLATMKTAKATPVKKRYEALDPAIRAMFDLPAMAKAAVGPSWDGMDPKDQEIIVDRFSRFTIATYAYRFDGYSGEHFEVDPNPEVRGEDKLVRTKIVKANGDTVALNYLEHSTPQGWKAIDVYLAGAISELSTRRGEFGALLKSGGPMALVDRLRQQTDRQLGT